MKPFLVIMSALTTFLIVGGGAMGAVLVALAGQPISKTAIWVCLITGLTAAMKDVRATMALPPLSNGQYQAISDFMKLKDGNTTTITTVTKNPETAPTKDP